MSHRVKYILNISREIDNFYPEEFKYLNIRYAGYWCVGSRAGQIAEKSISCYFPPLLTAC